MIAHSFVAAGYFNDDPEREEFLTPWQFCFRHPGQCIVCGANNVIKCSYCENVFCATHALIEIHLH